MKARIHKPECTYPEVDRKDRMLAFWTFIEESRCSQNEKENEIISSELEMHMPIEVITVTNTSFQDIQGFPETNEYFTQIEYAIDHCAVPDAIYRYTNKYNCDIEMRVRVLDHPIEYSYNEWEPRTALVVFEYTIRNKSLRFLLYRLKDPNGKVAYDVTPVVDDFRSNMWRGLVKYDKDFYKLSNEEVLHAMFDNFRANYYNVRMSFPVVFWYYINAMLLNPDTKIVETTDESPKKEHTTTCKKSVTHNDTLVYIRYLGGNESSNHAKGEFTRRSDAWYRIGHVRHLKNGKEVFVKGCICGPKKDDPSIRTRLIEGRHENDRNQ